MLETIVAVLMISWLLGMISSYSLGGALHLLLVVALVIIVRGIYKDADVN